MQTTKNCPIAHAVPSHEQNTELFQRLEMAKCRIREIKVDPEAHACELRHWEKKAEKATARLIEANLGLVGSIAKKYGSYGLPLADLISVGTMGLAKAIEKFDYRLGHQFATFSYYSIRGAITRTLSTQVRIIRIPEERLAEIRKVKAMQARLRQDSDGDSSWETNVEEISGKRRKAKAIFAENTSREPNVEEIAWALGMPENKVRALLDLDRQTVSMNAPLGDESGMTRYDVIQDKSAHDPSEAADHASKLELVDEAEQTLVGLEREIFMMHLHDHLSLNEIGKSFGRSGERIRQIYNTALKKVRAYVEAKDCKQPVQVFKAVVVKNGPSQTAQAAVEPTSSPVAKPKVYRLKMRAVEKNPNHHITNNNGTWYCKFTLELADGGKNEVRNSLYTDNVEDARKRRDKLILLYRGLSESFAA